MAARRVERILVTRHDGDGPRRGPDDVVVEEPMEVRLDGERVTTTMRTPGHDFELAVGFCVAEGLLGGAPVRAVRYCATGAAADTGFNVVTVDTAGRAGRFEPRLGTTTAACGLCGSTALDDMVARIAPAPPGALARFVTAVVAAVPGRLGAGQSLFASTGAVHAAAAFDEQGDVVVAREDVGRHNAVDKVVGRLHLDGALPAHRLGLAVSGRASFEMVQKAWAAGFAAVVAVGAPTSLAVRAAATAGMTLVGFARPERWNVYAGVLDA